MIQNNFKTVETFDGSVAFQKDCRYIKGEFYVKNKQCYNIAGTWYRINSGLISYDHEVKGWVVTKDSNLVKGAVGYDAVEKKLTMGFFTPDDLKNVTIYLSSGTNIRCLSKDFLPSELFIEETMGCFFYHKDLNLKSLGLRLQPANFSTNGYPFNLSYCMKHYSDDFLKDFIKSSDEAVVSAKASKMEKFAGALGGLTFGFEFETASGKIPNYLIKESGLVPLRDGSISGIEYATLVLEGQKGIRKLSSICDMLKRYTSISENESLHLHIGGFPVDKTTVGYMYTLMCVLEEEIYSLFPKYYIKTSLFKARQKDYNMPLRRELVTENPTDTFNNIAYYLGSGKKYAGFGANHPADPSGDHKWGINERYHWVNFIPTLFGASKTVEFRCHIPTRDSVKVINWLYICAAIVRYAVKIASEKMDIAAIKGTKLSDVINSVYMGPLASYLNDYVSARKSNRREDDANGDYSGTREISQEMNGIIRYGSI
jgi:hypothetical protein